MLSLFFGCYKRDESLDDKLTLKRVGYNGNELRIDGYYRHYVYVGKEPSPRYVIPYILYRNGIIFGEDGASIDRIVEMEEQFRNGTYAIRAAERKWQWGVFQINGNQIKYEKWAPGETPFYAFTYEGMILNDTTFVINKYYRMRDVQNKAQTEVYWEYHFKQFSPKPDSTNRFIP